MIGDQFGGSRQDRVMQITRHDAGRRRHGNARVDSPFQPGDPHM
jgi:hypothetical protein